MFNRNNKKSAANPMLQHIATNAQPVTTIAGAAAALGMAAYWLSEANKSIRGRNTTRNTTSSQQENKPAEKKQ